jgi:DNA-binding transcriptional LysR family regulator
MNVRFLEAFVWVARLGSFRAAADKLHTTQAGISSRIATLEEQFGVRLFDREHRSVLLTYHGTQLMPHAERMIELQARMVEAMGQVEHFSGMLRIGAIETVAHTWLPGLLSRFAARFPNATLELDSDITPRLRDHLLRGTLDCAILSEEITPGFIDNHRIANFAMVWVTGPRLAARLPAHRPLSLPDLAEHPIISFHRESGVYRNIAQGASHCANLRVSYFSSMGAMLELARAGFGSALLPMAVVQEDLRSGRLVLLPVAPTPNVLPLVASVRLEPASPMASALVRMAQEACDEFVASAGVAVIAD